MTRLSPSTVCCRACAPWPPGSAMLMPLGRRAESQTPMAACGALAAASHRFRSTVRRGNPGHRHNRQSNAEKMSRLQDALPGDPQRAWQRRPNPLLLNPLRFAPESTGALAFLEIVEGGLEKVKSDFEAARAAHQHKEHIKRRTNVNVEQSS